MNFDFAWEAFKFLRKLWRKRCLLIIDDNGDDAELLRVYIKRAGYKTEIVTTAEAGLAVLRDRRHAIAFVDIRLPLMSGMQLVREIRSASQRTHIVLVCGLAEDLRDLPRGRYVGVIAKPVTLESIEDCVKRL